MTCDSEYFFVATRWEKTTSEGFHIEVSRSAGRSITDEWFHWRVEWEPT